MRMLPDARTPMSPNHDEGQEVACTDGSMKAPGVNSAGVAGVLLTTRHHRGGGGGGLGGSHTTLP